MKGFRLRLVAKFAFIQRNKMAKFCLQFTDKFAVNMANCKSLSSIHG